MLNFINVLEFEKDDDFFYDIPIHRRLMTEAGICYTINLESNSNLFTKEVADYLINFAEFDGYPKTPSTYPVHSSKSGREYGLTIVTENIAENFNSMCTNKDGFKVMLHSPQSYPRISSHYIDIPADSITMIAITPVVITTDEDLRKYDPKVRHCYFDNERKLKFFKRYSQSNCEFECYVQRLFRTCGCVAFYMLHRLGTRICQSRTEKMCFCEFRETYGRLKDCDCLPSCNFLSFETEITTSKKDAVHENVEHVAVYFKSDYFLRIRRTEVFGWTSFWSSIGGFLGLLMGGSVLSVIEVFYNIFLRDCFWKGRKSKLDDRKGKCCRRKRSKSCLF